MSNYTNVNNSLVRKLIYAHVTGNEQLFRDWASYAVEKFDENNEILGAELTRRILSDNNNTDTSANEISAIEYREKVLKTILDHEKELDPVEQCDACWEIGVLYEKIRAIPAK